MLNKFMRATERLYKGQKGMTGLETAIILIAFVTVAAVFGYAVLSAGLFSAEKGKEALYAGLEQARSSVELKGSIYATGDLGNNSVSSITITLGNAIAGLPVDMTESANGNNTVTFTYSDKNQIVVDMGFNVTFVGYDDGDQMLDLGEAVMITVDLSALGTPLTGGMTFTLQVLPPNGAPISIERTIPGAIDASMDLH